MIAKFPNTNLSSRGHLPISGGNSSNPNPAKSSWVNFSSAAWSIRRLLPLASCPLSLGKIHFIVIGIFGIEARNRVSLNFLVG
jgi:hypothetical protein